MEMLNKSYSKKNVYAPKGIGANDASVSRIDGRLLRHYILSAELD
jgi:hypothetical protein